MNVDYPFHFDGRERTALTDYADHVRDMIEQILFTMPGERVNRPNFGSGVMQLLFNPASPEVAATTEFMIRGALQQWLGDVIAVDRIATEAEESTLRISIDYVILRTGDRHSDTFVHGEAGP